MRKLTKWLNNAVNHEGLLLLFSSSLLFSNGTLAQQSAGRTGSFAQQQVRTDQKDLFQQNWSAQQNFPAQQNAGSTGSFAQQHVRAEQKGLFQKSMVAVTSRDQLSDSLHLTLDQAYDLARQHYPVIRQKELVQKTSQLTIANISKGYLPQLNIAGQATIQSAVTSVPIKIPGIQIDEPEKDQYKITAEVSQLLYDGGNTAAQKNIQQVNSLVEDQKAEVELYKVKERINQLYLGILLTAEQLNQTELVKKDIRLGIQRVIAQVQNGTALRSNQLVLEAELLKADQRSIELQAMRKGLTAVLSLFIGKELSDNVALEEPSPRQVLTNTINRPELQLFSWQDSLFSVQSKLIKARNLPRASAFVQGGYGRPGLNMLKNQFDWFYIGGLRLNWNLGGLYTARKEKQLLEVSQRMVDVQKDVFLLNTNTQLQQQLTELNKWQQLIDTDQQIIDLRTRVKEAANAQLENGVITANDFMREVNAEDQARLAMIAHRLQLLQSQISYNTIAGNQ